MAKNMGYYLYSNSMASNVQLSSDAPYFHRIAREMNESKIGDSSEKQNKDLHVKTKGSKRGWNTKEPVY